MLPSNWYDQLVAAWTRSVQDRGVGLSDAEWIQAFMGYTGLDANVAAYILKMGKDYVKANGYRASQSIQEYWIEEYAKAHNPPSLPLTEKLDELVRSNILLISGGIAVFLILKKKKIL